MEIPELRSDDYVDFPARGAVFNYVHFRFSITEETFYRVRA